MFHYCRTNWRSRRSLRSRSLSSSSSIRLMEASSLGALDALLASIAVDRELTNEHLMTLMHLCSQQGDLASASLMSALRLLDIPDSVERVVASVTQRAIYKVKDLESDKLLTCRPTQRHCSCDRFIQVVMRDTIACEHVLAAYLSEALGIVKETSVSDIAFAEQ